MWYTGSMQVSDVTAPVEEVSTRKKWVTKLMHPSYIVEWCPVCGFPEADGGYCAECGWVHCDGREHDNRPVT